MFAVIVNDWLEPWFTLTEPEGEIVPSDPALAEIVYVTGLNVAEIVCELVTFQKV